MAYKRLTKKYELAVGLTRTSGNIVEDYIAVVNRLAELEDMIESGQAFILSCNCKIGDLVYGVADYLSEPKLGILTSVEVTKYCIQYGIVDKRLMRHDVKYVYSTANKEEAEAKLEELKNGI